MTPSNWMTPNLDERLNTLQYMPCIHIVYPWLCNKCNGDIPWWQPYDTQAINSKNDNINEKLLLTTDTQIDFLGKCIFDTPLVQLEHLDLWSNLDIFKCTRHDDCGCFTRISLYRNTQNYMEFNWYLMHREMARRAKLICNKFAANK